MGSFLWEEHGPWVCSMLSQMGSFPLEEYGFRVPSLMSPADSFLLEEPLMRSDLEAVDPKPTS